MATFWIVIFSIVPPSTISSDIPEIPSAAPEFTVEADDLRITQLLIATFLNPAVVSVPNFRALQWLLNRQSETIIFSLILSQVLLKVIPSSSESPVTRVIITSMSPVYRRFLGRVG